MATPRRPDPTPFEEARLGDGSWEAWTTQEERSRVRAICAAPRSDEGMEELRRVGASYAVSVLFDDPAEWRGRPAPVPTAAHVERTVRDVLGSIVIDRRQAAIRKWAEERGVHPLRAAQRFGLPWC